ncbi:MAG: RNA polymerase sigma factor [Steroidobacteraceae bacterium]
MDLEPLVRRARQGDVKAFVELTRGYQHLAFGSALALVHELPKLAEPTAFPAWLRSIVRHQAHRVLRRGRIPLAPLEDASEVPSGAPTPDHHLEQHREAAAALAAIAELPATLREPATRFFIDECGCAR